MPWTLGVEIGASDVLTPLKYLFAPQPGVNFITSISKYAEATRALDTVAAFQFCDAIVTLHDHR
jgi:hypothetical protein